MSKRTVADIMSGKAKGVSFRAVLVQRVEGHPLFYIYYQDGVGLGEERGTCYFQPPPCNGNAKADMDEAADLLSRPSTVVAGDLTPIKSLGSPVVAGLLYDGAMVDLARSTVPTRQYGQHCPACPTMVYK